MDQLANAMRNSAVSNAMSQLAADIRRLEFKITKLESEIIELKQTKNAHRQMTALENLALKGATYEPQT